MDSQSTTSLKSRLRPPPRESPCLAVGKDACLRQPLVHCLKVYSLCCGDALQINITHHGSSSGFNKTFVVEQTGRHFSSEKCGRAAFYRAFSPGRLRNICSLAPLRLHSDSIGT
jgi:hypothetical protein